MKEATTTHLKPFAKSKTKHFLMNSKMATNLGLSITYPDICCCPGVAPDIKQTATSVCLMLPVSALSLSIDIKKNVFRFFTRWEKTC
jgi:hypothetical protein